MRILQTTLLGLLSVGLFAIALPASAAIIATDDVEAGGDYTGSDVTGVAVSAPTNRAGGSFTLPALVGSNWVETSNGGLAAIGTGQVTHTAGFGAGVPIAAGTYTLTVSAGRVTLTSLNRDTFDTFEPFLETTAGSTALPDRVVTDAFAIPAQGAWDTVVVEYTVPLGSALIGSEFTWGYDHTFNNVDSTPSGSGFMGAFDGVSVDFVAAIPEPSSLLLVGLGMIGLVGYGRRRFLKTRKRNSVSRFRCGASRSARETFLSVVWDMIEEAFPDFSVRTNEGPNPVFVLD